MKTRPVSELQPHPLNEEVYGEEKIDEKFLKSVKRQGILVPLKAKKDGTIVSGHRRWRAAKELGIEKVPVDDGFEFDNELEEKEAILDFNEQRDKTFSQKMREAELREEIEREKAKKRQAKGKENLPNVESVPNETNSENGRTDEKVAKDVGFGSKSTYRRAKKVWEKVKEGNETAEKLVGKLDKGKKTVGSAYRKIKHEEEKEELEEEIEELESPEGKYNVIVIDPPWPYGTRYDPDNRRVGSPYPEMGIDELKEIDLPATEDCILWLWTTNAFMHEAYHLLDSWNFEPKTILTWVKDRMGVGHWLRGQTEHCILATKGDPEIDLTNETTVLHAKNDGHSIKPDEFYEMVDGLCLGKKLDYFSRREREGWDTYGTKENE